MLNRGSIDVLVLMIDTNIIETLANDFNFKRRKIVAENTSDPAILRQLAQDSNVWVRYGVVDNSHISNNADVLEILVHDKDDYIRRRISKYAYKYPELLSVLLADSDEDVVADALVYAPDDMKQQYIDIDNEEARYNIASFTNDPEILDILSYDSSTYVRHAVAENENTTIDVLDRLALSENGDSRVLGDVLKTHNVSKDVLLTLAKSGDRRVRFRVAYWCDNKKYRDILEILAEDPDDDVRECARRNLHWM